MTDPTPRIGYLTGEYPRATDTFIQREVAGLRRLGFEVDTFAVRPTGAEHLTGPEQEAARATTTYLLELARGPALPRAIVRALLSSPARLFGAARLAWDTRRPGIRGTVYQVFYLAEALLLAQLLRQRRIDHLHNHFGDSSCSVAMLASAVSGIPYSFTLHGSAIFFEARSWRLDAKLDRAAFCTTISHFTRSQAAMFARSDTMDRVHIVHCGVEPARLSPKEHEGSGSQLIFVGRVVEQKGLAELFGAMVILLPHHPDLTLTVVGDGPDRPVLERRAAEAGLADRVRFVGARSQDEVSQLLSEADIFVLPSYAEGVPVVVMEALGTALPVVASFVGGLPELVEDAHTGYLVRPGDPEALADRIGPLISDPGLRQRLGQAGRNKVLDEFDSGSEAARLASLFTASARGRPSPIRPPLPPRPGQPTSD